MLFARIIDAITKKRVPSPRFNINTPDKHAHYIWESLVNTTNYTTKRVCGSEWFLLPTACLLSPSSKEGDEMEEEKKRKEEKDNKG